jgi:hypothetical protein
LITVYPYISLRYQYLENMQAKLAVLMMLVVIAENFKTDKTWFFIM